MSTEIAEKADVLCVSAVVDLHTLVLYNLRRNLIKQPGMVGINGTTSTNVGFSGMDLQA